MSRNPLTRRERTGILVTAALAFLSIAGAVATGWYNRGRVRFTTPPAATTPQTPDTATTDSTRPTRRPKPTHSRKKQKARTGRQLQAPAAPPRDFLGDTVPDHFIPGR